MPAKIGLPLRIFQTLKTRIFKNPRIFVFTTKEAPR